MTRPPASSRMMQAAIGTLEAIASLAPDLLPFQLGLLSRSPAARCLRQLASHDTNGDIPALAAALSQAAADLDRLLRQRRKWHSPQAVLRDPDLPALTLFAEARLARLKGNRWQQRLPAIHRRLQTAWEHERTRARILAFLDETG